MSFARIGFSRATSTDTFVAESTVHKFTWLLNPSKELVELPQMLHLWLGCVPLQGTNEDNNIQVVVREISDSSEKRHAQLAQLKAAQIFNSGVLQLSVDNRPRAADKHNLIKGDLLGLFVLNVADSHNF